MRLTDLIYASTGLTVDTHTFASDPDGQILIASLLALVARSDGGISPDEILRMVQMLRDRFHLKPGEALNLVTRAADQQAAHSDLDELMDAVNAKLTLSNKEELLLMVLNVIAADNQKDAEEMKLLAALVDGLKIPDGIMDNVYARYFKAQKGSE